MPRMQPPENGFPHGQTYSATRKDSRQATGDLWPHDKFNRSGSGLLLKSRAIWTLLFQIRGLAWSLGIDQK